MSDIVERLREWPHGHKTMIVSEAIDEIERLRAALAATPAVGGEDQFHPGKCLPDCMMPDGGECCPGYVALYDAYWHLVRAAPPASPLRGRESVREIAHRHCTCTCRDNPAVLQNHTNLCDEISDAILEYAALFSAAPEALKQAEAAFEYIRIKLINQLNEPARSAFWKAVESRDSLRVQSTSPLRETCIECGKCDPCDDDCPNYIGTASPPEQPAAAPVTEDELMNILDKAWPDGHRATAKKIMERLAAAPVTGREQE